jgi:hypothetical protein
MTSPEQADVEAMREECKRLAEQFANQKIASGTMGARDARFALFAAIDRLAAVALHPAPSEPVAWIVFDEKGLPHHVAGWRESAQEHINDAINEFDLEEARQWVARPVYATPQVHPAQTAPAPVDARKLAWELAGVLEDVKRDGFDDVCLRTIQRVHAALLEQPNGGAPAAPCEFCEANKKLADIALRAAERQQRMGHLAELHGTAPAAREADERSLPAEFEIRCNGDYAASVCGPREEAWREACRYLTVYGQDGSVTIHEVTRRLVAVEDTGVPQDSEPTRSDE